MNTPFTELMSQISISSDNTFAVSIPECWMQGRTTYGGLSAALCLEAVHRAYTLPPLRSAQITFVGPASGLMEIQLKVLRQGRSVCFISVGMMGEQGMATQAVFSFGERRESKLEQSFIKGPHLPPPEASEQLMPEGEGPVFLQHYEHRLAEGARPFTGSEKNDHYIWARHKDDSADGVVALMALADIPPPAVLPMIKRFPPVSSMSWMLNFLTAEPQTDDGWWLLRTTAENASEGYSSQNMMVWNRKGEAVITARQSVAVFY